MSWLVKRSFTLAGHRTSIALETEFWLVLEQLANAQGSSLAKLVSEIDAERSADRPLASSLRVHALNASR
ncbi:MAG: ribbon-helix-helix domain-containing protein [Alphaproteobacteria bacterium]|nr:ribbon-helix-helix domain-containing protein [Alphaproteobacteria bacterium]